MKFLSINGIVVMCEPQVFGLWAGSSLPFFEISGFGRVRVGKNLLQAGGQEGIYVLQEPNLGIEPV